MAVNVATAISRCPSSEVESYCFDRDHAHAIGLVGGIRTIIDAMKNHSNNENLQRGCAGIIKHLACASPYNFDLLDRMRAVSIIVGTMERHGKSASLLESCCWALEAMAWGSSSGGGRGDGCSGGGRGGKDSNSEIKMCVAKGGTLPFPRNATQNNQHRS